MYGMSVSARQSSCSVSNMNAGSSSCRVWTDVAAAATHARYPKPMRDDGKAALAMHGAPRGRGAASYVGGRLEQRVARSEDARGGPPWGPTDHAGELAPPPHPDPLPTGTGSRRGRHRQNASPPVPALPFKTKNKPPPP